jgi:hypothetical protein
VSGRLAPIAGAVLIAATPLWGGPPYQTDDPEPTELHHWEIYAFVTADGRHSDLEGEAGLDLNYGGAKDLQLTATVPIAFAHSLDSGWRAASGDLELGAKYRFLNDEKHGWQAAVFPRVILPTSGNNLGGSRVRILLPLWVQKDFGATSIFGGGGFEINRGAGQRDFWQAGLAVTHEFDDSLSLGGELNWQSADTRGGDGSLGFNAAIIKKLGGPYSLLLAAGPSFSGGRTSYHSYTALSLNF